MQESVEINSCLFLQISAYAGMRKQSAWGTLIHRNEGICCNGQAMLGGGSRFLAGGSWVDRCAGIQLAGKKST